MAGVVFRALQTLPGSTQRWWEELVVTKFVIIIIIFSCLLGVKAPLELAHVKKMEWNGKFWYWMTHKFF